MKGFKVLTEQAEKGLTLIEILLAIIILSIGLLAVAALQTGSAKGNTTSSRSTQGLTYAVTQLETLMDLPWDDPDLVQGTHGPVSQNGYTITWNVTDNGVINNTKTITLTVTWRSWGLQKQISVQHVIPRII